MTDHDTDRRADGEAPGDTGRPATDEGDTPDSGEDAPGDDGDTLPGGLDTPAGPIDDGSATVPDFAGTHDHVVGTLVWFGRRLRLDGAAVPANAALDAARALATVGLDDRDRVRAALQATLVTDADAAATFDEHFDTFWRRLRAGIEVGAAGGQRPDGEDGTPSTVQVEREERMEVTEDADAETGESAERRVARVGEADQPEPAESAEDLVAETYSAAGEGGEVCDVQRVQTLRESDVRRFERAVAALPGRRWRPGDGARVDARRALRRSLATGGTPVSLPRKRAKPTVFRPCVLADVSGSVLDTLDRGLLVAFLARLQRDGRGARTFLFDTELREVTGAFDVGAADADPVAALRRAEVEWGGGTRIGDALATLRHEHSGAVDRRTVVVIVSDGLDVGDPEVLERGMAWLSRRAAAVLWLNPLAASPRYEPTCRGMATALPYVDGLFAFAESADLAEVARQLDQHGLGGRVGYEHDPRRVASD